MFYISNCMHNQRQQQWQHACAKCVDCVTVFLGDGRPDGKAALPTGILEPSLAGVAPITDHMKTRISIKPSGGRAAPPTPGYTGKENKTQQALDCIHSKHARTPVTLSVGLLQHIAVPTSALKARLKNSENYQSSKGPHVH
jgi:hypothetical protein